MPWRRITFATVPTSKRFPAGESDTIEQILASMHRLPTSTMPVENANTEWPEDASPYRTVARLRLPRQNAFSPARRQFVDGLSFCVSHSLVAHRPLGSIMRARLRAYPEMSRLRRSTNGVVLAEPVSVAEVPA